MRSNRHKKKKNFPVDFPETGNKWNLRKSGGGSGFQYRSAWGAWIRWRCMQHPCWWWLAASVLWIKQHHWFTPCAMYSRGRLRTGALKQGDRLICIHHGIGTRRGRMRRRAEARINDSQLPARYSSRHLLIKQWKQSNVPYCFSWLNASSRLPIPMGELQPLSSQRIFFIKGSIRL